MIGSMKSSRRKRWVGLFLLSAGLLLGQASWTASDDNAPPLHTAKLDELAVSIFGMFLTEDYEPIRGQLRLLQDSCRELKVEERERFGPTVLDFDRSFHRALDRVRELASGGSWDDSEKQYYWVLRSCVGCHRASREVGLGPPVPLP